MSNGQGGTLRRNAHTGGDTTARLRPFHVERVQATTPWDPSSRKLPVGYDISDPNSRIRNGRIRYTIVAADREVVIHRQRLQRAQLVHGRCYELSEAEQWDGTITEGLDGTNGTENRIGEKVTADLSPIGVIVEVWNNTNPEPGTPVRGGRGRTSVPNEWLSSGVASVDIDSIIRARWDKEWVIPYDDPDEPDRGVAGLVDGGGDRVGGVLRDLRRVRGRADPRRHGAGDRLDVALQRCVVLRVVRGVVAHDVDHRDVAAAGVVQVGEAVAEPTRSIATPSP